MSHPLPRLLSARDPAPLPPVSRVAFDTNFIIVFGALFCAVLFVLAVAAVARCVCHRRFTGIYDGGDGGGIIGILLFAPPPPPSATRTPANKRLNKKILRSLPKVVYSLEMTTKFSPECAICLVEFAVGDEIRWLPPCGHGFHVACIDRWFKSHSSCPSCRRIPDDDNAFLP